MSAKSKTAKLWYAPFFARLHEGLIELGFSPEFEDCTPKIIPSEEDPKSINTLEVKSYKAFELRHYYQPEKDEQLRFIVVAGNTRSKGIQFDVLTALTCPPVLRLLAILQGVQSPRRFVQLSVFNPFLSMRRECRFYRHDDQLVLADEVLSAVKTIGFAWFDEKSQEFLSEVKLIGRFRNEPYAIAAALYNQDYEAAEKNLAKLEALFERMIDRTMQAEPGLSRQQAEELFVGSDANPDGVYGDRKFFAKVRQACAEKSLSGILAGRSLNPD